VTPPRDGSLRYDFEDPGNQEESITLGETLILQCIICGIVLVVVLVASMTDIAPAVALRGGISQALSGAHTLDELVTDVRQFGTDWLGWTPVDDTMVDVTPEEHDVVSNGVSAEEDSVLGLSPAEDIISEDNTVTFDEEFFHYDNYFNNQPTNQYPAADEQASNQTVPEPPDTPGLWD